MRLNEGGALQAAEKNPRAAGQGFIPGIRSAESARALQDAEKLVRAVGRGFIPGNRAMESTRALAQCHLLYNFGQGDFGLPLEGVGCNLELLMGFPRKNRDADRG
jgi:hypothetical protein